MAIFGLNNYTKSNAVSEVGGQGLWNVQTLHGNSHWEKPDKSLEFQQFHKTGDFVISGSKSRTIPDNWPRSHTKPAEGLGAAGQSRAGKRWQTEPKGQEWSVCVSKQGAELVKRRNWRVVWEVMFLPFVLRKKRKRPVAGPSLGLPDRDSQSVLTSLVSCWKGNSWFYKCQVPLAHTPAALFSHASLVLSLLALFSSHTKNVEVSTF